MDGFHVLQDVEDIPALLPGIRSGNSKTEQRKYKTANGNDNESRANP
jgi:hypothetical protein